MCADTPGAGAIGKKAGPSMVSPSVVRPEPTEDALDSPRAPVAYDSYIRELAPPAGTPSESPLTSTLSPTSAARRLIEALVERGVDTFFGIPGGPVCPVFEAIRLTPGARLVESRHESHAAFAATLFQRASGRVPAVVVTAGPGITNAVTGIASASLERVPMLVIAGDVAWATTGGRMAQDSGPEGLSAETLLSCVTRAQVRAAHSRSVVSQALAALELACSPVVPGPALFVLPLDLAMGECADIKIPARMATWSAVPPTSPCNRPWPCFGRLVAPSSSSARAAAGTKRPCALWSTFVRSPSSRPHGPRAS